MDAEKSWPVREGRQVVSARIITDDVEGLLAFMRSVFGATGEYTEGRPTDARFGSSAVIVSDGGGVHPPMPAFMLVYVPDVDAVHARAVEAGATSMTAPVDEPWGDRCALVVDAWGNRWDIATAPS